jgi:hypothetical protein
MRHARLRWLSVVLIITALAGTALADEPEYGFGGGGPSLGLFRPDLTEINGFAEGAGFAPFGDDLILVGGGGRGGSVPGPALGGAGWGAWIESQEGDVRAEFGVGLGGLELGFALGGDEHSVLTFGTLLGGGGAELVLTQYPPIVYTALSPRGIAVHLAQQIYNSVFAFVAPYVDMQIQLLGWMGLGVRAGYLWAPLELHWSHNGPLDPPDLSPSGPYVRFSVVFGGIGRLESKTATTGDTTSP